MPSISHYELLDEIGVGGMGTVYRARDSRAGSIVALKVLHPHLSRDSAYVRRFEREARVARSIASTNVVRVLDSGRDGVSYFLVMEYVPGHTLAQVLARRGRLPVDEAVAVAVAIARGLQAAHERGIIHRDVSPQNVLITPAGEVKVADFGVARDLGATAMTATSMLLGKPQYIAPEVVVGQRADIRSDIYSLGVVLHQVLAGAPPFDADTPYAVMQMQVSRPVPSLAALQPDVPAWLVAIVERCLAKQPSERYQTPADLIADLTDVLAHERLASSPMRIDGSRRKPSDPKPRSTPKALLGRSSPRRRVRLVRYSTRVSLATAGLLGLAVVAFVLGVALLDDGSSRLVTVPEEAVSRPMDTGNSAGSPEALTTAPGKVLAPPLPDRTSCDEIRGSDYRSEEEHRWFGENCGGTTVPPSGNGPISANASPSIPTSGPPQPGSILPVLDSFVPITTIEQVKGNLVFNAKLDGTGGDFQARTLNTCGGDPNRANGPDQTATEVRFLSGSYEVTVIKPWGNVTTPLNTTSRTTYVVEYDIVLGQGSTVGFWVGLRTNATKQVAMNLVTGGEYVYLAFNDAEAVRTSDLSSRVSIPGVKNGRRIALAAAVDINRYIVFVDGKQVLDVRDAQLSPTPQRPGFAVLACGGTNTGSVRVMAARVYELAKN